MTGTHHAGEIEGRLLDLDYRVRCDSPAVTALLRSVLADSAAPVGASATEFELRSTADHSALLVDGEAIVDGPASWVFSNLLFQMNRHSVGSAPQAVVLHAGAVERDGLAVIVAGPSGAGKTVTTLGLAQRGFGLLSDDIVRLRPDGWVDGARKPVGVRSGGARLLGLDSEALAAGPDELAELSTRRVAATTLGVAFAEAGRPVAIVYPDADRPADSLIELSPGHGLARCCDHVFSFGVDPAAGFERLGAALDGVVHLAWGHGDLDRLRRHLDETLSRT